jgi:hypothetical protein
VPPYGQSFPWSEDARVPKQHWQYQKSEQFGRSEQIVRVDFVVRLIGPLPCLGALAQRSMDTAKIYKLYPRFSKAAIRQAIDLEAQLERNLLPVAA